VKDAVRVSVEAGIDMSMVPDDYSFSDLLLQLVQEGTITESRIDDSVRRILQLKINLGLFTSPMPPKAIKLGDPAAENLSLQIARESLTLLKNAASPNGKQAQVLPLTWLPSNASILVVGPSANSITNLCGGWTIHWQGACSDKDFSVGSTIYNAITQIAGSGMNITYRQGCSFDTCAQSDLNEVAQLAAKSTIVILAIGEAPEAETPGDTEDLSISPAQLQLYSTVASATMSAAIPVVTVLVEPRPRVLGSIADGSNALIMAYLPCVYGGQAIGELLFGKYNPVGRLPLTYPSTTGDIDVYYHKPWGTNPGTVSEQHNPLGTFGFGLSYTQFMYSGLTVTPSSITAGASFQVSVKVTNNAGPGGYMAAGNHTVLFFVSQEYRSAVTPEDMMLKAFTRVELDANGSIVASVTIDSMSLGYWTPSGTFVVEPGTYWMIVGVGQQSTRVQFTLVGSTIVKGK